MIPKRIASIRFGLMDPTEIRKMSSVEVKTADTYKDDGHAYRQGLMDPHMGVIEPGLLCPTDNCKYDESPLVTLATFNLSYQSSTLDSLI
jgi:DNA-directed RNA polymerase subunit A'